MSKNLLPPIRDLVNQIKQEERKGALSCIAIGNILTVIHGMGKNEWKKLGSHCISFDLVCQEIGYKKTSAYNYMGVAKYFSNALLENPDIDVSYNKMVRLLPVVSMEGQDPKEHLIAAASLGENAIKDYAREKQGKKPFDSCQHKELETWYKCLECNEFLRG